MFINRPSYDFMLVPVVVKKKKNYNIIISNTSVYKYLIVYNSNNNVIRCVLYARERSGEALAAAAFCLSHSFRLWGKEGGEKKRKKKQKKKKKGDDFT